MIYAQLSDQYPICIEVCSDNGKWCLHLYGASGDYTATCSNEADALHPSGLDSYMHGLQER